MKQKFFTRKTIFSQTPGSGNNVGGNRFSVMMRRQQKLNFLIRNTNENRFLKRWCHSHFACRCIINEKRRMLEWKISMMTTPSRGSVDVL